MGGFMYKSVLISVLLSITLAADKMDARVVKTRTKPVEPSVNVINSMSEYETAAQSQRPTVIVFNSDTCEACTQMEPCTKKAAEEYPQVTFYCANAKSEPLKELKAKADIKAYPTTHFIKNGKVQRSERGSLSQKEMDDIVYELLYDKRKRAPKPAPKKDTSVTQNNTSTPEERKP
jgi:thioredoxin-related protein